MKFKIKCHTLSGVPSNYLILHPSTAIEKELNPGTLLVTEKGNIGFRLLTSTSMEVGFAGISPIKLEESKLDEGQDVRLVPSGEEGVTRIIRRKMNKKTLNRKEIETFITALDHGILTNSHIAAFGTAVEINGMHTEEIVFTAQAIIDHSKRLSPKGRTVVDKHSIGGIAGNRITPLMIPIVAATGLAIPKISTRAITSPAGTVDALETVMPTDLTYKEASEVLDKTGACMVNGATVGLGSVADKFLDAVKQVKIDPQEMMIASILSKKKAAGSEFVLIDLPTGKGSKLPTREKARALAYDFSRVGNKLDMRVECVISPGDKPVGSMIGPSLEMTEVMRILENTGGHISLKRKAVSLSGLILEGALVANRGEGMAMANEILESGKALSKFREIVEAQGGDPNISSVKIEKAPYSHMITAEKADVVYSIDSYNIGLMARAAGAPSDKLAGMVIYVDRGDILKKGDRILEIESHSESKLTEAIQMMKTAPPISLERSILEHITGVQE